MKQAKYKFSETRSITSFFKFDYDKVTALGNKIEKSKKHLYIFIRKTHKPTAFVDNKSECIPLLSQLGFVFVHRILERFPILLYGADENEEQSYGEWLVIEGRHDISGIMSSLPEKIRTHINFFELSQVQALNITRTSVKQTNICDYRIVIETKTSKKGTIFSICKFKDYFSIQELAQTHQIQLKFSRVRPESTEQEQVIKIPVNTDFSKSLLPSNSEIKYLASLDSPSFCDSQNSDLTETVVDSSNYLALGKELIFENVDYFFYLKILIEGKEFIKHSTSTFRIQSRRKLFFTRNLEYLCWTKPDSMVIKKKFKASEIHGWTYGRTTKNFARFKTADAFSLKNSFSILLENRTIDLEAYYYEDLRDFCKGITLLPELSKIRLV